MSGSDGSVPEGWDDLPEDLVEAARGLRTMFIALMTVGFTTPEAAQIIGATLAMGNLVAVTSTNAEVES